MSISCAVKFLVAFLTSVAGFVAVYTSTHDKVGFDITIMPLYYTPVLQSKNM